VEEYIWEFELLQMRVGLNEDNELTIAKFIKGLSPSIANKVGLQPYLSINDVCWLAIKIEKQLKGRRPFLTPSPYRPESTPKVFSCHNKIDHTPTPINEFDKDRGIFSEPSKRLDGKKCFTCHGYGHFQAYYPN